jgi:hypothetical protein
MPGTFSTVRGDSLIGDSVICTVAGVATVVRTGVTAARVGGVAETETTGVATAFTVALLAGAVAGAPGIRKCIFAGPEVCPEICTGTCAVVTG